MKIFLIAFSFIAGLTAIYKRAVAKNKVKPVFLMSDDDTQPAPEEDEEPEIVPNIDVLGMRKPHNAHPEDHYTTADKKKLRRVVTGIVILAFLIAAVFIIYNSFMKKESPETLTPPATEQTINIGDPD